MRATPWLILVPPALVAAAPAARAPMLPPPLLPLSDRDTTTGEYGCESSFTQGDDTYIHQINRHFLIRTAPGAAGLHDCTLSDAEDQGFGDGHTSVSCGGRSFVIRTLAPIRDPHPDPEADSEQSHAILTMSDGTHTRQVRGEWGTAC